MNGSAVSASFGLERLAIRTTRPRSSLPFASSSSRRITTSTTPQEQQASASTSQASTAAPASVSEETRNPFLPWKNPTTGRWWPAKYSHRRQAQLAEAAFQMGTLSSLPEGPKTKKLITRLQGKQAQLQEEAALQGNDSAKGEAINAAFRGWRLSQEEDEQISKAIVRSMKDSGPYSGRKKMFKGTKGEREYKKKQQNIANKLEAMPKTVAEWKEVSEACKGELNYIDTVLSAVESSSEKQGAADDAVLEFVYTMLYYAILCYRGQAVQMPGSEGSSIMLPLR